MKHVQVVVIVGISFTSERDVRVDFIDEKVLQIEHVWSYIVQREPRKY